jgi:hypothetical protein
MTLKELLTVQHKYDKQSILPRGVVSSPTLDHDLGFGERVEDLAVEQLVAGLLLKRKRRL